MSMGGKGWENGEYPWREQPVGSPTSLPQGGNSKIHMELSMVNSLPVFLLSVALILL